MADKYISPSGNDSAAGTIGAPWKSPSKLNSLNAGDTLWVRGGTYDFFDSDNVSAGDQLIQNKNGTPSSMISMIAYPSEVPIFQWGTVSSGSQTRGIHLENCTYIKIKGIRVTRIPQKVAQGSYNYGFSLWHNVSNCIVEMCEADHIGGSGFHVGPNSNNNTFTNCDAHHNADPYSPNGAYENANGFEFSGTDMGNNVTCFGCRAWWNADDGFDTFNDPQMATFINCWSFYNGYIPGTFTTGGNGQGFKIGQCQTLIAANRRQYTGCIAYRNRKFGFDQNFSDNNHALRATFYNNTAYLNGDVGFWLNVSAGHILKNNAAYGNGGGVSQPAAINSAATQANNSWQGAALTDASFVSVNSSGIDGARQSDGTLPNINFLKPAGRLVDGGVNVGLPYTGAAPDIGAQGDTSGGSTTYYSAALTQSFTRNNCGAGYNGSQIQYTVAAGAYSTTVSQIAANALAQADMDANGQAYANANGTCTAVAPTIVHVFRYAGVTYTLLSDHTWHT